MFLASFRNRTAVGIASVATMLGLWFGLTAPAVSPVFGGPPGVATTVQQVAVLDQNANAAGGTDDDGSFGGGARGGANGGRR